MTRNQCYELLGLRPGATEAEIKRQYKRMALRVHPDINPDPKANEQFIQLSRAVEILLSPEPTPAQQRQAQRQAKQQETEVERKQRMEEARRRFEQQKAQRIYENARYFKQLTSGKRWIYFRTVMVIGWFLALALILDVVLPTHLEEDKVVAFYPHQNNGLIHERICAIELENSGTYFVESLISHWTSTYPEAKIEKTWLLHTPVTMYTSDDFEIFETDFDFHLGSIRWVIAILLLVPLYTYLRRRHDLTFVLMYQFSFWGVGGLVIFLLFTEERLKHLLTLGFA